MDATGHDGTRSDGLDRDPGETAGRRNDVADSVAPDEQPFAPGMTMEATRLWVIEARLAELFRVLVRAAEKPGPVRRDLLSLLAQVQRLQVKTVSEARRR